MLVSNALLGLVWKKFWQLMRKQHKNPCYIPFWIHYGASGGANRANLFTHFIKRPTYPLKRQCTNRLYAGKSFLIQPHSTVELKIETSQKFNFYSCFTLFSNSPKTNSFVFLMIGFRMFCSFVSSQDFFKVSQQQFQQKPSTPQILKEPLIHQKSLFQIPSFLKKPLGQIPLFLKKTQVQRPFFQI